MEIKILNGTGKEIIKEATIPINLEQITELTKGIPSLNSGRNYRNCSYYGKDYLDYCSFIEIYASKPEKIAINFNYPFLYRDTTHDGIYLNYMYINNESIGSHILIQAAIIHTPFSYPFSYYEPLVILNKSVKNLKGRMIKIALNELNTKFKDFKKDLEKRDKEKSIE